MRRFSKYFFTLIFSLVLTTAFSQKKHSHKFKATFALAEKNFEYGYYQEALNNYMKIYQEDTMDIELNYKISMCHFREGHHPDSSMKFLLHDDASNIPDVQYLLGKLFHAKRDFNEARAHYEKLRLFPLKKRKIDDNEIDRLISITNRAEKELKTPHIALIKNLGPEINSKYHEYVPLITADGGTLFFTSKRPGGTGNLKDVAGNYFEDIYISHKTGLNWSLPVNFGKPINTKDHDACVSISNDGKHMLLYRPAKNNIGGDIYESKFSGEKWSEPKVLNSNVNTSEGNESSANISSDGNFLIFSSNKAGGFGGKDLYICRKLPNGSWSKSVNMGSVINTPYDEDAPFLTSDDKWLYFSSRGHTTLGGYDVFKSKMDFEKNSWSVPENLGYPINDVSDDIFFVLSRDEKKGFYSSEKDDGFGGEDLYQLDLLYGENEIHCRHICVFELGSEKTKQLDTKVTVKSSKSKDIKGIYRPNKSNGKVTIDVLPYEEYQVIVQSDGYEDFSFYMDKISPENENREISIELKKK
ncbi:MAG: hypothetical protein ACK5D5_11190 [Bacteroidota bacterium]|jgi:hypothetical protein